MTTRQTGTFAFCVLTILVYLSSNVLANVGNWCQPLIISLIEKPPYVATQSDTQIFNDKIQINGAFQYPLTDVFTKCFSKKPHFVFRKANSSEDLLRLLDKNATHIALPFISNATATVYRERYRFVALFDHPGTEYYTRPSKNKPPQVLMDIVFSSWPLFAFTFSLAAIAGILIWITDTFWNVKEFPRSFVRGAWEGFWWSFISMTTVGYGDKAPKSILARILAVVWIQIGLVVTAIFMANITTALTSMPNEKDYNEEIRNTSVAVLGNDTEAIAHVEKQKARAKDYKDFEQIKNSIEKNQVSGFIMDRYEAGHYFKKYSKLSEELTGALLHNNALSVGLLIGNGPGSEWPATCLENHIFDLHQSATVVQDIFKKMLHHSRSSTKTFNLFSSENVTLLKEYTMYIIYALAALVAIGLVWDAFFYFTKGVHRLKSKKKSTVATNTLSNKEAVKEISELKQVLMQLQSSVEKLEEGFLQTTKSKRQPLFTTTHV